MDTKVYEDEKKWVFNKTAQRVSTLDLISEKFANLSAKTNRK